MDLSSEDLKISELAELFSKVSSEVVKLYLYEKDVVKLSYKDASVIENLMSEQTEKLFGKIDIYHTLYTSYMTLGIKNGEDEIVGVVSFQLHPNITSIPSWDWLNWMRTLFGCESVKQSNCVWINLLLWKEKYEEIFLSPMLEFFFKDQKYMEFVMIAFPPRTRTTYFLGDKATRVVPTGHNKRTRATTLALMAKNFYFTPYRLREAIVEDNDDLVNIISLYSPIVQKLYGDFYISELLTRFPELARRIIVADFERRGVAVLIANDKVNYEMLNERFDLSCFNGLKKPNEEDYFGTLDRLGVSDQNDNTFDSTPDLPIKEPSKLDQSLSTDILEECIIDEELSLEDSICRILLASVLCDPAKRVLSKRGPKRSKIKFHDDKEKTDSVVDVITNIQLPKFKGEEDAYIVEILASRESQEAALDLLLNISFELFPDRNYCCMSMPTIQSPKPFLDRFVSVPPRSNESFPHDVFVMHKAIAQADVDVRYAILEDIPDIKNFISKMRCPGIIMEQIEFALSEDPEIENETDFCFLLISLEEIVGIAIVSENMHLDYILSNFRVFKWVNRRHEVPDNFAVLENLIIYPTYHYFISFFLSIIHTLSNYTVLFYFLTADDMTKNKKKPFCNALQRLVPIKPALFPKIPKINGSIRQTIDTPICLFLSNIRMTSIKRIEIHTRIVVVGFSDTAIAFLKTLVHTTSPDVWITFTNIVVISPHCFEYREKPNKLRDAFFVHRGNLMQRFAQLEPLRVYVNMVQNSVLEIDRKKKLIVTDNQAYLPYDYLFLLIGEQYQTPILSRGIYTQVPHNVFLINNTLDAANALQKINDIIVQDINPEGKVVIYGHDLRCHCAINALVQYGVPKDLIVYINPVSRTVSEMDSISYDNFIFEDPEVEEAIMETLMEEGIEYHESYFIDWTLNTSTNIITQVKFGDEKQKLVFPSKCLFAYSEKYVSESIYRAIKNASILFDGKIVIDENYLTNDQNIYAAGPATRYSTILSVQNLTHLYYNPEEVGKRLALFIRKILIPEKYRSRKIIKKTRNPFKKIKPPTSYPEFSKPIVKVCSLLKNTNYCHITIPGKQIPSELKSSAGKIYVTGDPYNITNQGYFKIHLNEGDIVQSVTCLTHREININKLLQLYGQNEKGLNNIKVRFKNMRIKDFYEFFEEPWTCGLYHDQFNVIKMRINELVMETQLNNMKTMPETVIEILRGRIKEELEPHEVIEVLDLTELSGLKEKLETEVTDYLEENEMSVFAYNSMVGLILKNFELSIMFHK